MRMADRLTVVIDGEDFVNLDGFYEVVTLSLHLPKWWGRNLDAFNDVLVGGIGRNREDEPLELIWMNSEKSRKHLGYDETVRVLSERLKHCHPSNRHLVRAQIEDAKRGRGYTVFDELVEIIRGHAHISLTLG
jgi:RNAse (barnase) inhibitor barstar